VGLLVVGLLAAAAPALAAASPPELWTVGRGNATITCGVAVSIPGRPPSRLLCDAQAVPAPPGRGVGDPGYVFLQASGAPQLARLSEDEFAGTTAVRLASGAHWSALGVSCVVGGATVRCVNRAGDGFVVGEGAYTALPRGALELHSALPAAIRQVDWKTLTVPASLCGTAHAVPLVAGSASAASTRWPGTPRVAIRLAGETYGDLDRSGEDAAAVDLTCSNLSGMADGELADGWLVYLDRGGLHLVGELTTRGMPQAAGLNPTIIGSVAIEPGRLTAREVFYRPSDPTCCPSGRATALWRYHDGTVSLVHVTVGHA
jgi:hypothetical protein